MCYWTGSEGEEKRNIVRFTCVYFEKMGDNIRITFSLRRSRLTALVNLENAEHEVTLEVRDNGLDMLLSSLRIMEDAPLHCNT